MKSSISKYQEQNKHPHIAHPRMIKAFILYVFIILLVSIPLTVSKYQSSANANATSRVAVFDVGITPISAPTTIDLEIGNNQSYGEYTFSVRNTSEVTIAYSIAVQNLPTNVDIYLDGVHKATGESLIEVGSLDIQASATHTLRFIANANAIAIDTQVVSISIYAEQVD